MGATRGGWVKFQRSWLDHPLIHKDNDHLIVWLYLVANAAIEPTPAMFGGKTIVLQRGQLTTGRRQLAEACGVQQMKCFRTTNEFESAHLIEQQKSNKNTLITVLCGFSPEESEQQDEQPLNNGCTTAEQQVNTLEEERIKKDISSPVSGEGGGGRQKRAASFPHDSDPFKAAEYLSQLVSERYPECKPRTERDLQRWADAFDKCHRLDGHNWSLIGKVLTFSQADQFWRKNVRSGDTFRRQFDALYAQMMEGNAHD